MNQALIIIDVQNDYFEGGKSELHKPQRALTNIEKILAYYRQQKLPVIHIQHINTREGASFFLPNSNGVNIHQSLAPLECEYLVVKHAPNSFLGTNLANILAENGIQQVVVCGMMSHMCVDSTVRACMDYGIKVTLLDDACATKSLSFDGTYIPAEIVHASFMAALSGMFATVIKTAAFLQ